MAGPARVTCYPWVQGEKVIMPDHPTKPPGKDPDRGDATWKRDRNWSGGRLSGLVS